MTTRVLVATPVCETKLYLWPEWTEALRRQDTKLSWDVLILDNTPKPSPGYVEWLRDWARSEPFGHQHRIRLKRFGYDVDGLMMLNSIWNVNYSERFIWNLLAGDDCTAEDAVDIPLSPSAIEIAANWTSYSHLLSLECDVLLPPHAIRTLYEANLRWAAGWMLGRTMPEGSHPPEYDRVPLLWHSLDHENWRKSKTWAEVIEMGYLTPPSTEPFECVVTHLGATLINTEVIREVPFRFTSAGGDVTYSWDVAAHGIKPYCVPSVACGHIAEAERPAFHPWSEVSLEASI